MKEIKMRAKSYKLINKSGRIEKTCGTKKNALRIIENSDEYQLMVWDNKTGKPYRDDKASNSSS